MKSMFFILAFSFVSVNSLAQDVDGFDNPYEDEFFFLETELLDSGGVFTFWGIIPI